MNILLIDGSPAQQSHTSAVLRYIDGLFQSADCATETITLKEWQLPYNDPAIHTHPQDHPHDGVRAFVQKVADADLLVLGTPLYHGSFSGLLKSALDHLVDDAFVGKQVLIVSNAAGIRVSQQAAQMLTMSARTMGGNVYHRLIGTTKSDYADQDGQFVLTDPGIVQRCNEIVTAMLEQ